MPQTRAPVRLTGLVATICFVLVAGVLTRLPAQQRSFLAPRSELPQSDSVQLTVSAYDGSKRTGGMGWVRVDAYNAWREEQTLVLRVLDRPTGGRSVSVAASLVVPAGERRSQIVPFPRTGHVLDLEARLQQSGARTSFLAVAGSGGSDLGLLVVGRVGTTVPPWTAAVDAAHKLAGSPLAPATPTAPPTGLEAALLPTDWRLLTGYDVVVVDGADPAIDGRAVATLLAYTRAGGRLWVDRADRIADRALARACERVPADRNTGLVAEGLGWLALRRDSGPLHGDEIGTLAALCFEGPRDLTRPLRAEETALVPATWLRPGPVSGVAPVPTPIFLAIVLGFVALVGPVNHWWLRRRNRAWLALLTVPVAGAVVTGAILLTTLLVEGLDVRGQRSSLTWLDQVDHRAATTLRMRVFASAPPARLDLPADTLLTSAELFEPVRGGTPKQGTLGAWVQDADGSSLAGTILPSRAPTALTVIRERACRDRLRFRAHDDGTYEVLAGGALVLPEVRSAGDVVFRDHDGQSWCSTADGSMQPVDEATATVAFRVLAKKADPDRDPDDWIQLRDGTRLSPAPPVSASFTELADGCFAAVLARPVVDAGLGLTTDWTEDRHVVIGRLDREDLLR